jgi:RNA polymerase sigma-70 factor (ECF subfamily)
VAEDLAGEVWLSAARQLPDFEGDAGAFTAWLFTVARRRVIDSYRRRGRESRAIEFPDELDTPAAGGDPADVVVEALSTQDAINVLARSLPPKQAEVVLLRVIAGLSVEQVGQVMGLRPGTVRVVQHRAVRRLARTWIEKVVTP